MKNASVTGATGLIGAHLTCALLLSGYKLTCLRRNDSPGLLDVIGPLYGCDIAQITWVQGSLGDTDELDSLIRGADVVFHCAAVVSFNLKDEKDMFATNIEGTRNVCNLCLKHNAVLIHVSSVAAIGRRLDNPHVSESTEWEESDSNSAYGRSKHLAEVEVWRGITEGLKAAIVNPGVVLGPGDGQTGSNSIFKYAMSGFPFYPTGINGFVDVRDVVAVMILLFEKGLNGKRYLLVSENLSYFEVLSIAAEQAGSKPPKTPLKGLLLKFLIAVSSAMERLGMPAPLPPQGLLSTSRTTYYHSVNIEDLNGFLFIPVKESIRYCIKSLSAFKN